MAVKSSAPAATCAAATNAATATPAKDGGRLGFGGGWYDRLLARIPDKTIKIGVCWNELLIDSVPMDAWDVHVDGILTEAGYVTSSRNNH